MTSPEALRAEIPALHDTTYLNYGAHGPSPRSVVDAARTFIQEHEFEEPASGDPYQRAFGEYEKSRDVVASFINARADEVALTESTTAGINAIACAIDWQPGDVVVRTDIEHPAGVLPWQRLEREGVTVRTVTTTDGHPDRDEFIDAVAGARLVSLSAVTWTHGTELPVAELVDIAHDAGAMTLIDAVQVPGQMPMDVSEWGADVVAAAGHKWLLGLWGSGFLYVDESVAEGLEPGRVGYRSVEHPGARDPQFAAGARRFEVGSANPAPHVALREAIQLLSAVGLDTIEDRIQELTGRLISGIPDDHVRSPIPLESGLVAIDVDDPAATVERLRQQGFVVREIPLTNTVRISIHAVNTMAEIDDLLEVLSAHW